MAERSFFLATASILLGCAVLGVTKDAECVAAADGVRDLISLSIHGKRNSTGDWVTFSAIKDSGNSSEIRVDVTHRVVECGGRNIIHIQGVIRGNDAEADGLLFSSKSGLNAAVVNRGRTARKIDMNDGLNGVVLTNRPLRDNEIFEVKLEKKGAKFDYSSGIGITVHSPSDHAILPHMNRETSGTWMFYGPNVWNNGTKTIENYGKNIYELQVGERMGVMRSDIGVLHFFVNGIDQGPAASNLPKTLYGVFELFGNAGQVTIIDP